MRQIKVMDNSHALPALELIQDVFSAWRDEAEGQVVRALVEEIRRKEYYLPQLELIMVDEQDQVIGYAMFSRFHLEGKYENELLLLTPVAVKTDLQRQHISKELIEYGLKQAKDMGYQTVLVEGDPANYSPRGFVTSADYGILPGPNVQLPSMDCLMICELVPGALEHIKGTVDYSYYDALS